MKIIRANEIKNEPRVGYKVKKLLGIKFEKAIDTAVFYETTIPLNGDFKEQWHKQSYESIYFLTSGMAIIDGKEYEFEKGDLLFLHPNEKHKFIATNGDLIIQAIRFPDLPNDKFVSDLNE